MERVNFKRLNVMELKNSISLKLKKGFQLWRMQMTGGGDIRRSRESIRQNKKFSVKESS